MARTRLGRDKANLLEREESKGARTEEIESIMPRSSSRLRKQHSGNAEGDSNSSTGDKATKKKETSKKSPKKKTPQTKKKDDDTVTATATAQLPVKKLRTKKDDVNTVVTATTTATATATTQLSVKKRRTIFLHRAATPITPSTRNSSPPPPAATVTAPAVPTRSSPRRPTATAAPTTNTSTARRGRTPTRRTAAATAAAAAAATSPRKKKKEPKAAASPSPPPRVRRVVEVSSPAVPSKERKETDENKEDTPTIAASTDTPTKARNEATKKKKRKHSLEPKKTKKETGGEPKKSASPNAAAATAASSVSPPKAKKRKTLRAEERQQKRQQQQQQQPPKGAKTATAGSAKTKNKKQGPGATTTAQNNIVVLSTVARRAKSITVMNRKNPATPDKKTKKMKTPLNTPPTVESSATKKKRITMENKKQEKRKRRSSTSSRGATTPTMVPAVLDRNQKLEEKKTNMKKQQTKQGSILSTAERRSKSVTVMQKKNTAERQTKITSPVKETTAVEVVVGEEDAGELVLPPPPNTPPSTVNTNSATQSKTPTTAEKKKKKKRKRAGTTTAAPTDLTTCTAITAVAVSPKQKREDKKQKKQDKKNKKAEKKKQKQEKHSSSAAAVAAAAPKGTFPPILDARVHRVRHLEYVPGSISAMASTTGRHDGTNECVAIARTDGSYEVKSILVVPSSFPDSTTQQEQRLLTMVETPPITGRKTTTSNRGYANQDLTDSNDSENEVEEEDDGHYPSYQCYDSATSLCWVSPAASTPPVCLGAGPNGNLWIVNFQKSNPIASIIPSGGGGIFDLTTCHCNSNGSNDSNGGNHDSLPLVAAACEDGSVRVWRVIINSSRDHEIQDPPLVVISSAGAPILSVAWTLVTAHTLAPAAGGGTTTTTRYGTVLFAAVADGTIRKYGVEIDKTTSVMDTYDAGNSATATSVLYSVPKVPVSIMRMTMESKGRKEPTKVWTLCLVEDTVDGNTTGHPNSIAPPTTTTLVSGNSLGQVQFWNADTGTLSQTIIQSSTSADVLKIVANAEGTKLFASGVDSKIVCLERKKLVAPVLTANTSSNHDDLTSLMTSHLAETSYRSWKMTISQRPHTHDVKAMVILSTAVPTSVTETLLTGGIDTKICSYSVVGFAQEQPQSWYPWPCTKSLVSATTSMSRKKKHRRRPKLLSMQRHDSIELYQLEPLKDYRKKTGFGIQSLTAEESHRATLAQHPMSMPVGTIRLGDEKKNDDDDDENDAMIISSSSSLTRMQASLLSPDGNYLAVSDAVSTYVFYLKYNGDDTHDENDSDSDQPGTGPIEPIKLSLPKILQNVSATAFHFVNDDLYVGDSNNRKVHIVRLKRELEAVGDVDETDNGDPMDVDDDKLSPSSASIAMSIRSVSLPEPRQDTNRNSESIALLAIQSISVSEDGKFLVTMNRSRNNAIHIFLNIKDKNKRKRRMPQFEHYWSLPSLGNGSDSSRPAAITMMNGNKLAVATYRSHVYLFDIDSKKLNTWSEQLGYPVTDNKWTEDSLCGRGYPLRLIPLKEQTDDSRLIMVRPVIYLFFLLEQTRDIVIPHECYDHFWVLSIVAKFILAS